MTTAIPEPTAVGTTLEPETTPTTTLTTISSEPESKSTAPMVLPEKSNLAVTSDSSPASVLATESARILEETAAAAKPDDSLEEVASAAKSDDAMKDPIDKIKETST